MSATFIKTIIIGGGLSGLFVAERLSKDNISDFRLIETSPKNIGGFSLWGDMKIGMPPAGTKTAKWLTSTQYDRLSRDFYDRFAKHLTELNSPKRLNQSYIFNDGLYQKYYKSFILSTVNGRELIEDVISSFKDCIIFENVINISKINSRYHILLSSTQELICERLIIASGRAPSITSLLKSLGETYHLQQDILAGCRITFNPTPAELLACNQLDFKVKHNNLCQTYCFNYRGNLHKYKYNTTTVYTGTLNPNSDIGNAFIGKRLLLKPDEALSILGTESKMSYEAFDSITSSNAICLDIRNFLRILKNHIDLHFYDLFFPAFEQFWPRPILKPGSLESNKLDNMFYVGDSSGISYGILQSYVTANYLIHLLMRK